MYLGHIHTQSRNVCNVTEFCTAPDSQAPLTPQKLLSIWLSLEVTYMQWTGPGLDLLVSRGTATHQLLRQIRSLLIHISCSRAPHGQHCRASPPTTASFVCWVPCSFGTSQAHGFAPAELELSPGMPRALPSKHPPAENLHTFPFATRRNPQSIRYLINKSHHAQLHNFLMNGQVTRVLNLPRK